VTPATVFVLEAGEAREAVVLVDDDVARAQVGERAQRATAAGAVVAAGAALGPAAEEPVRGQHGELQPRPR